MLWCCSNRTGGTSVRFYFGRHYLVYLGREDQMVIKTGKRGYYSTEVFRSKTLQRNENGDLVMEIPPGILSDKALKMWTAHKVPTKVQGVTIGNQKYDQPRPTLIIEQRAAPKSSATTVESN